MDRDKLDAFIQAFMAAVTPADISMPPMSLDEFLYELTGALPQDARDLGWALVDFYERHAVP